MNINEFIGNLSTSNMELIVKEHYISVEDKKNIALEVLEKCTTDDDGYILVDHLKRDIYFDIAMLREYTNLKLSYDFESMIEEYDVLCKHNVLSTIFNYIGDDYKRAKKILVYEEQNIINKNSIEAQVAKVSLAIINVLQSMNHKLEEFDFNSILPAGTDVDNLLKMLNKYK